VFAGVQNRPGGCSDNYVAGSYITVRHGAAGALSTRFLRQPALKTLISRRTEMTLGTILIIVLILMLLGVIPTWPHSRNWGYGPSGGLGLVLIVVIVLLLLGKI
jgi:hypothetical protein